jgi:hypothetical protein
MKPAVLFGLLLLVGHSNASASTPKSYMLVPARTTVSELEKLSHQSGTTAVVYTVGREERWLLLDGVGGNALTGQDLNSPAASDGAKQIVGIPFDDVALVYYNADGPPGRNVFPKLPRSTRAEQDLSCEQLNTEIGRAGTIRWIARRQGAVPFTEHEASGQHGKNFLVGVGDTLIVVGSVFGGVPSPFGGDGSGTEQNDHVSDQAYRWAVTAADQRILGLLELKHDRSCAPSDTRTAGKTDLMVLEKIDESRQAMAMTHITDQEQIHQQTLLLDQFDKAEWFPNGAATRDMSKMLAKDVWSGKIRMTDTELVFRYSYLFSGTNAPINRVVRVPYADLTDVVVTNWHRWRGVVVTHKDGRKDSFTVVHGMTIDREATQTAGDFLKSKMSAMPP